MIYSQVTQKLGATWGPPTYDWLRKWRAGSWDWALNLHYLQVESVRTELNCRIVSCVRGLLGGGKTTIHLVAEASKVKCSMWKYKRKTQEENCRFFQHTLPAWIQRIILIVSFPLIPRRQLVTKLAQFRADLSRCPSYLSIGLRLSSCVWTITVESDFISSSPRSTPAESCVVRSTTLSSSHTKLFLVPYMGPILSDSHAFVYLILLLSIELLTFSLPKVLHSFFIF